MKGYLLDTNVISELSKSRPAPDLLQWLTHAGEHNKYVSVLTIGELLRGATILEHRDDPRAATLHRWIADTERDFQERILPVDRAVVHAWASLPTKRTLPAIDALLAATAIAHGLTVATRNVRDFADTGADLVNPFEPSS